MQESSVLIAFFRFSKYYEQTIKMENIFIDPMWYILIVGYFILNFVIKFFIKKYKEERTETKNPNAGDKKPAQSGGDKKGGSTPPAKK